MLFNSIDFLVFYPIVLMINFIIPAKIRYLWLLVSSYYFYMCWNVKYAILIFSSTVITYCSGLLIEYIKNQSTSLYKKRKYMQCIVFGSCILNLGILFIFKYFNFSIVIQKSIPNL